MEARHAGVDPKRACVIKQNADNDVAAQALPGTHLHPLNALAAFGHPVKTQGGPDPDTVVWCLRESVDLAARISLGVTQGF